ncbi:MAG: hypothetical protein IH571_01825 [Acholeplasmataceae bacterium]|nr:hypothetical protein [Acholeplasmataceae bacterium]
MKSFEHDLKEQLNTEKTYLPISKKLVVLLRDIQPFVIEMEQSLNQEQERFVKKNLSINRNYLDYVENSQKALKIILEKNQNEVEKTQKANNLRMKETNRKHLELLNQMDLKIEEAKTRAQDVYKKAEQGYQRELSIAGKRIIDIKAVHQHATTNVEKEKKSTFENLNKHYEERIIAIENDFEIFQAETTEKKALVQAHNQQTSELNDDSYLTIKNSYNHLSVQLNKKISDLKKHHTQAIIVVEKDFTTKKAPIEKAIDALKIAYDESKQKTLASYSEKLNGLNVIFDVQKLTFESKKEKIIHESGESITLLNSKLSAFRETIGKDKLQTSREMRDEMKTLESNADKDRMNHQLTRKLNAYDNELNKQIIRTRKDIFNRQRVMQNRLFLHDQNHLKEINDWRLKRVLFEYQKKQETAILEMNFAHNMNAYNQQLKLCETYFTFQKEMLLLNHNRDVLPLETQLLIAASIQERELNLLANDAHLSIANHKIEEQELEFQLKKKMLIAKYDKDRAQTRYEADQQVNNISTQLEIEKEKAKRDLSIQEQDLKIQMSGQLREKTKLAGDYDLNQEILLFEHDRELIILSHQYELEQIKQLTQQEFVKRQFISNEARFKNQQLLSNEKTMRLQRSYRNELEFNQEQSEIFMQTMRMMHQHFISFRNAIKELYLLPCHPEVFKSILGIVKDLHVELETSMLDILETYQEKDQTFYAKKVEDLTGYKYMLKHENLMNTFDSEIRKVEQQKSDHINEIRKLENLTLITQTNIEKNLAFIEHLEKINQGLKEQSMKRENRHLEIKENNHLISNHEHDIKRLTQDLQRLEKEIEEKHKLLLPINNTLNRLDLKQEKAKSELDVEKHKEAALFYRFMSRNQVIYQILSGDIRSYILNLNTFMQMLANEVYISETFLEQALKQVDKAHQLFEKQLMTHQQKMLNLMLSFYLKNEKEQNIIVEGFKKSTSGLIKSLNKTHKETKKASLSNQKKAGVDLNRKVFEQKQNLKKKLENHNQAYQKNYFVIQTQIKSTEDKITQTALKLSQEVKLLSDNQQSIALQFEQEYQNKINSITDNYQKELDQISNFLDTQNKNHIALGISIETKNQALLGKYQVQYEKILFNMGQKQNHIHVQMNKAKESIEVKHKNHQEWLKRINQRREDEIKNIQEHLRRFTLETKSMQNKTYVKEIRILRKSHRFKMRMLKLN